MTLTLFFRLISMSIFQSQVCRSKNITYNNTLFFCPRIKCKDGWNISLQIHNGNYCESENGYRELGHTMQSVEFGFPSSDDKDLHEYSEMYNSSWDEKVPSNEVNFSAVGTVGRIPVEVIQSICDNNHGGIDWEATISVEQFEKFIKMQ